MSEYTSKEEAERHFPLDAIKAEQFGGEHQFVVDRGYAKMDTLRKSFGLFTWARFFSKPFPGKTTERQKKN